VNKYIQHYYEDDESRFPMPVLSILK